LRSSKASDSSKLKAGFLARATARTPGLSLLRSQRWSSFSTRSNSAATSPVGTPSSSARLILF
jgi:hypothetical protein